MAEPPLRFRPAFLRPRFQGADRTLNTLASPPVRVPRRVNPGHNQRVEAAAVDGTPATVGQYGWMRVAVGQAQGLEFRRAHRFSPFSTGRHVPVASLKTWAP